MKCKKNNFSSNISNTYKALIEAIIPENSNNIDSSNTQSLGAAYDEIDKYEILSLNHAIYVTLMGMDIEIHLSEATKKMLDKCAKELIIKGENKEIVDYVIAKKNGIFAALSPEDRFRALSILQQLKVDLKNMPIPYWNNPDFIVPIINSVLMFCTIGYYSGWSGYCLTSRGTPVKRKNEHLAIGWKQIGYPGPSKGYHAFRGYLFEKFID